MGNFCAGGGGQLSANYANCLMLLPEQIVAACCKFLNVLLAMWECWWRRGAGRKRTITMAVAVEGHQKHIVMFGLQIAWYDSSLTIFGLTVEVIKCDKYLIGASDSD